MEYYVVEKKNNLGEQYIEVAVFQAIALHELSKIKGVDLDNGKGSVSVDINEHNQVIIDLNIGVEYGMNVSKVVNEIQTETIGAVERYVGFRNVKVNVNINKIIF